VGLGLYNELDMSIYEDMEDEDIVEEAKTGDPQALEYLI
jgi:RNA polymerase sporulation-specific sigma factor